MNEYNNIPHELDWEDEISNEGGEYVLLEEGDYNFTVAAFERGRFPGSAKIPACKKATLTLAVNANEGTATVKYDLILYSTLEWKICEFFRSIGQKKHGEKVAMNWGSVIGSKGRARFVPRSYTKKDGSTGVVNNVEKFYDYDPQFFKEENWVATAQNAPEVGSVPPRWTAGQF